MDSFRVAANDTTLLETSHLVEEMRFEAAQLPSFRVLLDGTLSAFHGVDGGYHPADDAHIVNLIHEVQMPSSPTTHIHPQSVEAHMKSCGFYMDVEDSTTMGSYPDEDFVLSLKVSSYMKHPHTFCGPFGNDVDRRETRYDASDV